MESLIDSRFRNATRTLKKLGDRSEEFATLIEGESFRQIVGDIYNNTSEQGGRPNMDTVLMVKMLVLQSIYNLSDPELEQQANDRILANIFLGKD